MPVYDYRCEQCGSLYDVYHKVREVAEDVLCPECGSHEHKKLMSVPAAVAVGSSSAMRSAQDSCGMGDACCGGQGGECSVN
jgi:putative FmdB family regulatory protein